MPWAGASQYKLTGSSLVTQRVYKRATTCHCYWGGDSSVVRAPDSWLKGRGFESLLERRENFILQGRLSDPGGCWLLFRYPFHPRVTTVARKRSRSFNTEITAWVGKKLQLNTHTPYVCGFYWTVLRHWSYVKWHLRTLSINSSSSSSLLLVSNVNGLTDAGSVSRI